MATGLIGLQLFLLAYESRLVQFVLVKSLDITRLYISTSSRF